MGEILPRETKRRRFLTAIQNHIELLSDEGSMLTITGWAIVVASIAAFIFILIEVYM